MRIVPQFEFDAADLAGYGDRQQLLRRRRVPAQDVAVLAGGLRRGKWPIGIELPSLNTTFANMPSLTLQPAPHVRSLATLLLTATGLVWPAGVRLAEAPLRSRDEIT